MVLSLRVKAWSRRTFRPALPAPRVSSVGLQGRPTPAHRASAFHRLQPPRHRWPASLPRRCYKVKKHHDQHVVGRAFALRGRYDLNAGGFIKPLIDLHGQSVRRLRFKDFEFHRGDRWGNGCAALCNRCEWMESGIEYGRTPANFPEDHEKIVVPRRSNIACKPEPPCAGRPDVLWEAESQTPERRTCRCSLHWPFHNPRRRSGKGDS